jgi:MFS family permease
MSGVAERRTSPWRSRNVILLGLVSLLNDSASEMVVPLLPAFLATLGVGAFALGWVEGISDFVSSVLKLVVGRWSDRLKRAWPFVLFGYALAAFSRPFLGVATAVGHVLAVRVADRTGKGFRTAPRDRILAASVPRENRGAAFGVHRAFDHLGAVIGPLFAALLLWRGDVDLRTIFFLAVAPGLVAVAVVLFGVRDPRVEDEAPVEAGEESPVRSRDVARFLVPLGLFTLGKASETFLLLKAGAERSPLATLPLLWMALHVVKASTSVVGGRLTDRWGRKKTVLLGWSLFVLIYVLFAFARGPEAMWVLFVFYGAHVGLSEAAEKTLMSELVPRSAWGTGFGGYHLVVGALTLFASVLFGGLWSVFGSEAAFLTSAGIALVATALLAMARPANQLD